MSEPAALAILDEARDRLQNIKAALEDLRDHQPEGDGKEYLRGAAMGVRQALGQLAELRREYE